jgi:signal peptidase II
MKRWLLPVAGIALLVLLDQIVKRWVLAVLVPHGPIPLISGVLELLYVENRGAAFGIMQNRQWFFMIITVVVLLGLFWIYPRIPEGRRYLPLRLCVVFIAAGALGNMIDRITRGYVVDFIYFKLIDFPVFNIADIYVTCSAFALIYLLIFYYKDQELECLFHK